MITQRLRRGLTRRRNLLINNLRTATGGNERLMTDQLPNSQESELKTEELAIEQLEQAAGGFASGGGGGAGKVQMQDFHFLLPAV